MRINPKSLAPLRPTYTSHLAYKSIHKLPPTSLFSGIMSESPANAANEAVELLMGAEPEIPSDGPEAGLNLNETSDDDLYARLGLPRPPSAVRNKTVPGKKSIVNCKYDDLCEQFARELESRGIHKVVLGTYDKGKREKNTIQNVWTDMYTHAFYGYHDANGIWVDGYMSQYKDWAAHGVYNFRNLVLWGIKHHAEEFESMMDLGMEPTEVEKLCKPIWNQCQQALNRAKELSAAAKEKEAKRKRENEAMEKSLGLRPSEPKKKNCGKNPCLLLAGNPVSPAGKSQ